jgi:flagellar hook-associated protein 3 FlgL
MRISSNGSFTQSLNAMLARQAELLRTQMQMSTGRSFTTAEENPVAAGLSIMLDRADAELSRFDSNATQLEHRYGMAEGALDSFADRLVRVRELALQGANATQNNESRGAIIAELRQEYDALIALANTGDGQGNYLFAGSRSGTAPFAADNAGVVYSGDQMRRTVDISPSQALADVDPGSEIFMRIRSGNGSFAARANPANSGTALLTGTSLSGSPAYAGQALTLTFDGVGGYEVTDSTSTVVATGSYGDPATVSFLGVQISLRGSPSNGDNFSITPAPNQDVFATVQSVISALEAPALTQTQRVAQQNLVYAALEDLGQADGAIIDARSSIGARMNTLAQTADERSAQSLQLKTTLSELRDLDYAEAASRLTQQLTTLQAAQQTFVTVQGSNLFSFLR